jgi:hypothetical protein
MAELEAEMDNAEIHDHNQAVSGPPVNQTNNSTAHRGGRTFLPPGAVPSQNGVLSPHAAEFWFPESRNCPCCKGFKHGCVCRSTTVTTCQDPFCSSPEPVVLDAANITPQRLNAEPISFPTSPSGSIASNQSSTRVRRLCHCSSDGVITQLLTLGSSWTIRISPTRGGPVTKWCVISSSSRVLVPRVSRLCLLQRFQTRLLLYLRCYQHMCPLLNW